MGNEPKTGSICERRSAKTSRSFNAIASKDGGRRGSIIKKILIICLISIVVCLTGCWDRTEINDNAFVVTSGIDKAGNKKYRYTVQVPLPSSMGGAGSSGGGGGTSGEGPVLIAQGTGKNIRESMEDVQLRLSRKLYFAHRRVLVIGEDLAKEGISKSLRAVVIQPESRLSTLLLISKGDAIQVLKAQPRMEQYSGEALREMAKAMANKTVKDTLIDLDRPGKDPVIPFVNVTGLIKEDKKGKELEIEKFAVFKGDKVSFITNIEETQGILWLLEKMKKKSFTFSVSKDNEMTINILENQVKPQFTGNGAYPSFHLKVRVTGILIENEANLRIEDPKTYQLVKRKMEQEIKRNIQSVIKHSHSKGADIVGFGWHLYKTRHQKWQEQWKNDWEQRLPHVDVSVDVDADIQRTTNSGEWKKE
ncbi:MULTISPECIES: Ger(x)C family spore germination protein [Neobacillus]|uniref:Ger(x)C family spore germination protein n=1 Tax=Neobacillus TaxID=2675232 RepID=UPI0013D07DA5|nr:Ger(x)C family spore germination protein [Neobacillus sedimentimangrovi]